MTTPNRPAELLAAALAYAELGLYVVPLHEPLFDEAGNHCGCTCEAYKRSNRYRDWLRSKGKEQQFNPNYQCKTPGKHPRLADWETQASKDPKQIRTWWQKWPTANIGYAVGKSGFVDFDLDTYKDVYGGDDLFTLTDKQTTTELSQGGGEHLIYQMPAGKAYTNANNTLPPGIDIRGVGGMSVLPPSIGRTRNEWAWEDGYSIFEYEPKPLPVSLAAILDTAHQNSTPAALATFTTITTERPDLLRWRLSKKIRELINAPGCVGQRSENDMKVCTALCYAGATPDDILAIFQHHPVGTAGKYAERGPEYLARTVGKAQAFVAAHPRPDVRATLTNLMLWVRTHSKEKFIDPQLISSDGIYRTDPNDTKTATAALMEMRERERLTINIGKKRLAKLAGIGSCNTVLAALARLSWLFVVTSDPLQGMQITLDLSRLEQIDPHIKDCIVFNGDQFSKNDNAKPLVDAYSSRMADEPFLVGVSKLVRERIQEIAKALDIPPARAKEEYTFRGLGESGLRVIDAMLRAGDMTAAELANETGKKVSSIRTALRKLVQHGIVEAEREGAHGPKVYSLAPDVWQRIDEIAPNLRTFGSYAQRENKRLRDAQQWCDRGIAQAKAAQDAEKAKHLEQRKAKLAAQRLPHLVRLLEGKATQEEIKAIAYTPTLPFGPHPAAQAKLNRLHGQARMDLAEQRHKAQWETARLLSENIAALKASNTPKREWFGMLTTAGFTPGEAKRAIKLGGAA